MQLTGLVPHVPSSRPRAEATWWRAEGRVVDGRLLVERLAERDAPGAVSAPCGLAAPDALPAEFLQWVDGDIAGWTRHRLLAAARKFAARRERGHRHPVRDGESASALDRARLVRFHASMALRARDGERITCIDSIALLRRLDLPSTGLSGATARAIARRATILRELDADVAERDYAVASWPALEAVLCCYGVIP